MLIGVTCQAADLKVDAALLGGWTVLDPNGELGNAVHIALPDDVPKSGPTVGLRASAWLSDQISAEVGLSLTMSSLARTGDNAQVIGGQLAGVLQPMAGSTVSPLVRIGVASFSLPSTIAGAESDTDTAGLVGLGVVAWLNGYAGLRLDATWLPGPSGSGGLAHNFEIAIGPVYRAIDGADADNDGIPDRDDKCPRGPEDKDGFEDFDGCPDPDNDKDGKLDANDKCPNEAEDNDGFEDGDGCPDPDNDKDGIPDKSDKCPNKAETKNGLDDKDGCPDDFDSDKDGVGDNVDKCPKEKETKNGFQDDDGCPDAGDSDLDGIPDDKDKCPTKPETKNGYRDKDGCPDKARRRRK